jgi:hypothetical protein
VEEWGNFGRPREIAGPQPDEWWRSEGGRRYHRIIGYVLVGELRLVFPKAACGITIYPSTAIPWGLWERSYAPTPPSEKSCKRCLARPTTTARLATESDAEDERKRLREEDPILGPMKKIADRLQAIPVVGEPLAVLFFLGLLVLAGLLVGAVLGGLR